MIHRTFSPALLSISVGVIAAPVLAAGPGDWQFVPDPLEARTHFWNVHGTPDGGTWAVGFEEDFFSQFDFDRLSLTLRWNGSTWERVPSPSPGVFNNGGIEVSLHDVGVISADDAWAVGTYFIEHPDDGYPGFQTFAIHWDGSNWTQHDTPVTPTRSTGAAFNAIAAIASDNVFAAGRMVDRAPTRDFIAHVAHWDGRRWSTLPEPPTPGLRNEFEDIAAIGSNEILCVGGHSGNTHGARDRPYVARWNGSSWSLENIPQMNGQMFLESVTAVSPDDIWIVGSFNDPTIPGAEPLFIHFDGTAWEIFTGVQFPHFVGSMRGVSAVGSNDIWAVGSKAPNTGDFNRQLIMHFDGSTWSEVPIDPQSPEAGTLFATHVTDRAAGNAFAVGLALGDGVSHVLAPSGSRTLPATIDTLGATFGQIVSGDTTSIASSDDTWLRTRSQFGFSASESNLMELLIRATSPIPNASRMHLTIESHVNNPGGRSTVKLRETTDNQLVTVGSYGTSQVDDVHEIADIPAATFIRGQDGRVDLAIRHAVIATFSAAGFDSFFDHVELMIEE